VIVSNIILMIGIYKSESLSLDRIITIILFLGIGISILAFVGGYAHAKFQDNFRLVKSSQELVILRVYGDYLITAPLIRDVKGNQVETTLYILKMSEMDDTPLTLEKVGPLTVKQ
jgi:hypothetical protein